MAAPSFELVEVPVHNPQSAHETLAYQGSFDKMKTTSRRSSNFPLPCNVYEYGMLEVPADAPPAFSAFSDAGGLNIYSATTPKLIALLRYLQRYKKPGRTHAIVYTESPGVAYAVEQLVCVLGVRVEVVDAASPFERVAEAVGRVNRDNARVLVSRGVSLFAKRTRPSNIDSVHLLDACDVKSVVCNIMTSVGMCARMLMRAYVCDGTAEGDVDIASLGHHMYPSSHGENKEADINKTNFGKNAENAFDSFVSNTVFETS